MQSCIFLYNLCGCTTLHSHFHTVHCWLATQFALDEDDTYIPLVIFVIQYERSMDRKSTNGIWNLWDLLNLVQETITVRMSNMPSLSQTLRDQYRISCQLSDTMMSKMDLNCLELISSDLTVDDVSPLCSFLLSKEVIVAKSSVLHMLTCSDVHVHFCPTQFHHVGIIIYWDDHFKVKKHTG